MRQLSRHSPDRRCEASGFAATGETSNRHRNRGGTISPFRCQTCCMNISRDMHADFIPNLIAGALFLCIAASVLAFLTNQGDYPSQMFSWQRPDVIAAAASPMVFLCASILVVVRPRRGYALGLVGCLLALPLFVRMEISLAPWNSWIFLNQDGSTYFRGGVPVFAKLTNSGSCADRDCFDLHFPSFTPRPMVSTKACLACACSYLFRAYCVVRSLRRSVQRRGI